MNKRRLIPLFAAFVLWGSQYVISKIALRTVPPVTLLALRYLVPPFPRFSSCCACVMR